MVDVKDLGKAPSLQAASFGDKSALEIAHPAIALLQAAAQDGKGVRRETIDASRDIAQAFGVGVVETRDEVVLADTDIERALVVDIIRHAHQSVVALGDGLGEGLDVAGKLLGAEDGGPILSTWFDRPLTLAGRVIVRGKDAMSPETMLMHVRRPLLQISNLAIHFNRQVNDGVKLSKQKDTLPLLGLINDELEQGNLLMNVIVEELSKQRPVSHEDILDFDLYLADTQPACTFGVHDEFISSGRLDDLSMCFAGLEALIAAPESDTTQVLAIFDNEETGSQTKQGAGSPFLASMLMRIARQQSGTEEAYWQAVERAFMISADNAHAFHPNYAEKYDPTNHPMLGGGPAIKFNASQKYASDAVSAAIFAEICRKAGVPCQRFVNHSDVAGGSTLGNILASTVPLRGVDMGNAILGMHSCRETGSVADHEYCVRAFTEFYSL